MVAALKRHADKPVMYLGDTTLTGRETAERISQYVQAFEALGAGQGTPGALLALNRPEVLFILGAGQTQGYRRTSLHPLGSLDDHAYVLNDAEITTLIIDPVPMFVERALGLLEKVPGLTQVLTIGPVPDELARRRHATWPRPPPPSTPQPLEAVLLPPDHIVSITYTGGTTGKPKGVIGTAGRDEHDDPAPALRVGVAGEPAVPDVHAALARRRRVLRADGDQGRLALRAARASTRPRCCARSRSRRSPRPCWCPRCSTR